MKKIGDYEVVHDVNLLSPKKGERFICDLSGNGNFQYFNVVSVTRNTISAFYKEGTLKVTMHLNFGISPERRCFWRGLNGRLYYQYIKEVR